MLPPFPLAPLCGRAWRHENPINPIPFLPLLGAIPHAHPHPISRDWWDFCRGRSRWKGPFHHALINEVLFPQLPCTWERGRLCHSTGASLSPCLHSRDILHQSQCSTKPGEHYQHFSANSRAKEKSRKILLHIFFQAKYNSLLYCLRAAGGN